MPLYFRIGEAPTNSGVTASAERLLNVRTVATSTHPQLTAGQWVTRAAGWRPTPACARQVYFILRSVETGGAGFAFRIGLASIDARCHDSAVTNSGLEARGVGHQRRRSAVPRPVGRYRITCAPLSSISHVNLRLVIVGDAIRQHGENVQRIGRLRIGVFPFASPTRAARGDAPWRNPYEHGAREERHGQRAEPGSARPARCPGGSRLATAASSPMYERQIADINSAMSEPENGAHLTRRLAKPPGGQRPSSPRSSGRQSDRPLCRRGSLRGSDRHNHDAFSPSATSNLSSVFAVAAPYKAGR